MNRFAILQTFAAIGAGFLSACQQIPKDAGFGDVQRAVTDRSGLIVQWNGHTADDHAVADAVAKMLSRELTAGDAVQIALLNNHHLQATFEDLGIAQADLVQAGLLKNPVFDIGVRFPDRAPATTYLDIAAAEDFLDIVLLPARKRMATARFQQAKAEVTHEVLALASQTAIAFYSDQAAEQTLGLRHTIAQISSASLNASKQLRGAGNLTDLDWADAQAEDARANADLIDAESETDEAHEALSRQMGLWDEQTQWKVAAQIPDLPSDDLNQNLEKLAFDQRPDLDVAAQEVFVQSQTLGITRNVRWFPELGVGPEFERETDRQWRIGPTISLEVPIFDQGQAKLSRAQAVLRQSEQRYMAMYFDIASEVRLAKTKLINARRKVSLYHDEVLPTSQDVATQTQLLVNGMYAGVFQLLDAKSRQVAANQQYVEAVRDYWIARTQLEEAIGGRLPTKSPTTAPSQQNH